MDYFADSPEPFVRLRLSDYIKGSEEEIVMDVLMELKAKVDEFSEKLKKPPVLDFLPIPQDISEIRQFGNVWPKWAERVGIYVFYGKDKIHYIGRALKGTNFGKRISAQIAQCDEKYAEPWQDILNNSDTRIALFAFSNIKEDYWAASMEIFLIDSFGGQVKEFNKRRG